MRNRHYVEDPRVVAIHPGPDAGSVQAAPLPETNAARLARYEREMLDDAIEHFIAQYDDSALRSLAVQIIALRVEFRQ